MYPKLSSSHRYYDSLIIAKPIIDKYGSFQLLPKKIRFSRHKKIEKVSWYSDKKEVSLMNIGNAYTVVKNKLLIIDHARNVILLFNSFGRKEGEIKSPNLKSKIMIQGQRDYNGEKWSIEPMGIPIRNTKGEIIDHKSIKGDFGWFKGLIEINNLKYLMVTIVKYPNIEIQFLNLKLLKWLDTAIWAGIY